MGLSLLNSLPFDTPLLDNSQEYVADLRTLNTLQSNFAVVDAIRKSGKKMNEQAIPEMIEWLRKIGYQPSDLNALNAIHVAGTKGKGSTAAFISSILNQFREAGGSNAPKKIGLYTSPHLRFVRERIQINGQPLSEDIFARYFFETWDRLEASAGQAGEDPQATSAKPVYFRYLTLMAFHTYLSESVDCAVIECGIGGAYDSTNIIPSPAVTGITSLGIDHVGVLGSTIEEIAWHKAGIMKPPQSSNDQKPKCFTPSSQPTPAKIVLSQIATQQSNDLIFTDISPAIASGSFPLGLSAPFQQTNASLALAITSFFLSSRGVDTSTPQSQSYIREGLHSVSWPGRCETRVDKIDRRITWYIDGGHTLESIELAGKWFGEELRLKRKQLAVEDEQERGFETEVQASPRGSEQERNRKNKKNKIKTYLIFNQQTRDAPSLATALYNTLASTLAAAPTTVLPDSSEKDSKAQASAQIDSHLNSNYHSNNNNNNNPGSKPAPQSNADDNLQSQRSSDSPSPSPSPFSTVIFTTNTPYSAPPSSGSSGPTAKKSADLVSSNLDSHAIANLTVQKSLAETWTEKLNQHKAGKADVRVVRSIEEAISIARSTDIAGNEAEDEDIHKVVLVTGSLHLVGAVLEVLEGAQG